VVEPLLELRGLTKAFGALKVTQEVSLTVLPGEIHAVIGPNGAGKTTLVHQVSGTLAPDAGSIHFAGSDVTRLPLARRARLGLARSFQITAVLPGFSVLENAALAVQARSGHSFRFWRAAATEAALNNAALDALAQVGLTARAETLAGDLSHGERRQLELAIALAMQPRLLLLDEPLAGAGPEETERLVGILAGLKARYGILLVEHDMAAVFALADRISVLVYGQVIATGTPAEIRANAEVRAAYLGEDH
jgi:branched-chain amino acid transport system ATP-binding protein